jgi:hypothetical protein
LLPLSKILGVLIKIVPRHILSFSYQNLKILGNDASSYPSKLQDRTLYRSSSKTWQRYMDTEFNMVYVFLQVWGDMYSQVNNQTILRYFVTVLPLLMVEIKIIHLHRI